MTQEKKPKGILRLFSPEPKSSREMRPLPAQEPMRSSDHLRQLAKQIAENADLIRSFQENVGKDDKDRAGNFIDEVRNYALSIDPALTYAEGARLALLLTEIFKSGSHAGSGNE